MNAYEVGTSVDQMELDFLPPGTRIATQMDNRHHYQRDTDGRWFAVNNPSQRYTSDNFGSGYMITALPEGVTSVPFTATDYRWKFRNVTLGAAHTHGVSVSAVIASLEEMGASLGSLPIKPMVPIRNDEDIRRLPEGTLVEVGRPEFWDNYGLFRIGGGAAHHVLGMRTRIGPAGVLVAEVPESYVPPECDESEAAIDAFKVRAYTVGLKLKHAQGWCSTYESIVLPLGISRDLIRPLLENSDWLGQKVTPGSAAELPVGTILSWDRPGDTHTACSWFVRVADSTNRAGTRRLFWHADDNVTGREGHYSNSMVVRWVPPPDGQADVGLLAEVQGLDIRSHWQYLPPGTVISWNSSQFYVMAMDHRASLIERWDLDSPPRVPRNGDYRADAFHDYSLMGVVFIPTTGDNDE